MENIMKLINANKLSKLIYYFYCLHFNDLFNSVALLTNISINGNIFSDFVFVSNRAVRCLLMLTTYCLYLALSI